ncbi:MAG: DNA topoisomerase IB [Myxococcota bacterium]
MGGAVATVPGLRYSPDAELVWRRRRVGKNFSYVDENGRPLRDADTLRRIRSIAIPPAWTEVRICPAPEGHIQAVGRDARGRKQYRYHPGWRADRDETKYERTVRFGRVLPAIRARIHQDLGLSGLPREKVLATVVRLLELTLIRVGNAEYARTNKSYGLTTLRTRHVQADKSTLRFHFRGKSGVVHRVTIDDRRLARVVRECLHLPGQELFQYVDDAGHRHAIASCDVNAWLREVTGEDFTAKDFRTWGGTMLAARAFHALAEESIPPKKAIRRVAESVASRLGNTPAVCRSCYIHPAVVDAWIDGTLPAALTGADQEEAAESALLGLLEARTQAAPGGRSAP